jgi:hypothetical protein
MFVNVAEEAEAEEAEAEAEAEAEDCNLWRRSLTDGVANVPHA